MKKQSLKCENCKKLLLLAGHYSHEAEVVFEYNCIRLRAFICFLLNIAPGLFNSATGLLTTPRDSKGIPEKNYEEKRSLSENQSFESK